jgi:hypothetical protein
LSTSRVCCLDQFSYGLIPDSRNLVRHVSECVCDVGAWYSRLLNVDQCLTSFWRICTLVCQTFVNRKRDEDMLTRRKTWAKRAKYFPSHGRARVKVKPGLRPHSLTPEAMSPLAECLRLSVTDKSRVFLQSVFEDTHRRNHPDLGSADTPLKPHQPSYRLSWNPVLAVPATSPAESAQRSESTRHPTSPLPPSHCCKS